MNMMLKPFGPTGMTDAERARLWNSRRGVARAAKQIADNLDEAYDVQTELCTTLVPALMKNLEAALEELRAAEGLLLPDVD